MIEVDHLTKYYGSTAAVRDVTFTVERGEILGFLGPNGAGKSTTMRIITGYLPASAGTVRVDGYDVAEDSIEVRRRIGYLPESVPLYTDMSVFDYLNFMGKLKEMDNPAERKNRIWEVMEQVHVDDVANKLIGRLSRGYRQRVGLANALLHNPEVLILDEPTVGLDPRQIIEIRELIRSLGQDHTVILSTHILPEVSMICSRVVIINRGRLVALDTPINLAEDVAGGANRVQVAVRGPHELVRAALAAVPGVTAVEPQLAPAALPGDRADGVAAFEVVSAPQSDLRGLLAQTIVTQNWDLLELRTVTLNLEEIFLRVTSSEAPEEDYVPDDAYLPTPKDAGVAEDEDYLADDAEYDEEYEVLEPVAEDEAIEPEYYEEEAAPAAEAEDARAAATRIRPRRKGARR